MLKKTFIKLIQVFGLTIYGSPWQSHKGSTFYRGRGSQFVGNGKKFRRLWKLKRPPAADAVVAVFLLVLIHQHQMRNGCRRWMFSWRIHRHWAITIGRIGASQANYAILDAEIYSILWRFEFDQRWVGKGHNRKFFGIGISKKYFWNSKKFFKICKKIFLI